ncbi:MAG: master DNA invertase Mpi family serine-type recombinase [Treponema sp.]|nr:master DNA invertase Mpi family serine-type recombinase [Treponema sp.]
MVYGYIRVSTDKQTVDNQKYEIQKFCAKNSITIERWIEETNSGSKIPEKRQLGSLLALVKAGDMIICSELSRLGRSLFMIMSILNQLMMNDVRVWTIKDNYRLGDNIQSKVLAFAFGISAEIERELISQRTKEALARKKSEGKIMGRPKGKAPRYKLLNREIEIEALMANRTSKNEVAKIYGVSRKTVDRFLIEKGLPRKRPPKNTRN